MDDEIIFCVRSPLGYTVSCSQKAWNGHITPGHPEILGREDDVLHTVEKPYKIFLSKTQKSSTALR